MDLKQAIHRAAQYANQGKFAQADKICRDIIAANDQFHPAFHLLGQLAAHAGRNDVAVPMLERAAALDPNRATYHRDFAEVLIFAAKAQDALTVITRAVKLDANDPKSHFILGLATMSVGQLEKAIAAFKKTIKLEPNYGPAYNNLGSLLEGAGKLKQAKKAYSNAIKIDTQNVQAQNNLASVLIAEGDIRSAKSHLQAAIKARPDYIEAHHNLSGLKCYKKNDQDLETLKSIAKAPEKLPPINQARLFFILGKASEDLKNYDAAFDHYSAGNVKMRSLIDYDEKQVKKFNDALGSVFTDEFCAGSEDFANNDPTPVFIVGMPRSGSTLTEQILASHSDVYAAGELTTLGNIIKSKVENFPQGIEKLSNEELNSIGEEYLVEIKKHAPDAKRIIDKMPGNYRFAGLIAKILPGAKVIHTNRNAMDCCVSIYTRLFLEPVNYAYDLGELGRYYSLYQDLMTHWQNVLPEGTIAHVDYEELVANLEKEARELIDFIGLDWQDGVLNFHKQKSSITTASAAQVRKPIYTSSVARWHVYEKQLQPLIDVVGAKLTS